MPAAALPTVFRARLLIAVAAADAPTATATHPIEPDPLPAMNAPELKVFLVEDNGDTRYLLAFLLRDLGYEVQEAATMRQALDEFPRSHSHVLLSDVGLPDGNGCELLLRLRAAGESPYAIALSGFGASSDVETSLAAGFHHHLVKPIDLGALERLLEEAEAERDARTRGAAGGA